jgi:enoyl-CoA hydratase/carnithine racemase
LTETWATDPGLQVVTASGVTRLTLTRPESRNALTRSVCAAIRSALTAAAADPECRAVVIQGSGGCFASGADLAEFERLGKDRALLLAAYRELRATQELLYALDRPTVAAIDGHCFGAGLSLALACDVRIATVRSIFAAPPVRLGLVYSDREVWRLALRIGFARSRDLLFTGRRVAAAEAFDLGLIERLSEVEAQDTALHELLAQFAACAPRALRKTKQQLLRFEREGAAGVRDDTLAEEALFDADGVEGISAFLEHRAPRFAP